MKRLAAVLAVAAAITGVAPVAAVAATGDNRPLCLRLIPLC